MIHTAAPDTTHLLRILRDHEHQLEIVHPQRDVVQLVDVGQEDDILDGLLHDLRMLVLQMQQQAETRLIVWRLLAHVRREDRLDVLDHAGGLEEAADSVADVVDLRGWDGRARGVALEVLVQDDGGVFGADVRCEQEGGGWKETHLS